MTEDTRTDTWHGVVSETLPNGRVLIASYVRVGNRVFLRMQSYGADGEIQTHLDVDMRVQLSESD